MKRLIASCFLCFIGLSAVAQPGLSILSSQRAIGKNNLTGKEIIAKEFIFPERIHETYVDTLNGCITVQLRGLTKNGKYLKNTGNVVLYDLNAGKAKWSKSIAFQQSEIEQHRNLIIQTIANKSYCLNHENGENLWEVKNSMYYVDRLQKIGIGYKFSSFSGPTNTLEGIDLRNGNRIWQRELSREYAWNDIFHLNDSILVVVASGLHGINLKNGSGWDYNAVTGDKDYTSMAMKNVAGAALGILTGTYVVSTGHDLVRDIVSNVLVDSTNIYFASKESIACLNHKGRVEWSIPLPKDIVSKSSIYKVDDIIYMINKGYAFMGFRQIDYGTPFIAAFDTQTRKQIYFSTINGEKDQINGVLTNGDTLSIVLQDRVSKYSRKDGTLIIEKYFDKDTYGELKYFVGPQVHIRTDSTYTCLTLSDITKHYVYTKNDKILVLDDKLEIVNQIDYDQLYIGYLRTEDYKFLAKDEKTIVIDNDNKSIANLDLSNQTIKIGSKLYDIQDKSFVEIDLNDITKISLP